MTARRVVAGAVAALAAGFFFVLLQGPKVIEVPAGTDLQAAIDEAPAGITLRLAPGRYDGPISIVRPLTLEGFDATITASATDSAAVAIVADEVAVRGISVSGGRTGLLVRESERVELQGVTVRAAEMHGIELIDASVRVIDADVAGLTSDFAQGIEIRNSDGRPDSSVVDSVVVGGQEGIVSHVSEVLLSGNSVSETTLRGIAVTEMSDGIVRDNSVHRATGTALYCGDMSRCQFENNTSDEVLASDMGTSAAGWGLVVTYHAVASSEQDEVSGVAGDSLTSLGGKTVSSTPLEIGAGAAAIAPIGVSSGIALALLGMLFVATNRLRDPSYDKRRVWTGGTTTVVSVALVLVAVQSFHMFEHLLQVWRVRVDGVPSRGGLAGPGVEAEWVHFTYNAVVILLLGCLLYARRLGWRPPGAARLGDRLLMVAVLVQGYHVIEHSAKLVQHLAGGAKVNDGLLGVWLDLVLLHYGLNLAVYIATVAGVACYLLKPTGSGARVRQVPDWRSAESSNSPAS